MKQLRLLMIHTLYGIYRPKIGKHRGSFLRCGPVIAACLLLAGIFASQHIEILAKIFLYLFFILIGITFFYFEAWPPRWDELTERQKYDTPVGSVLEKDRYEWVAIQNKHPEWE